jgi:isopentenyl diphosphate isomerase/L-lactate dehydrogenase-like FMN-dependent dehydrogenase
VNADDFEALARRRLPRSVFDAIAGGAGDETTVRVNRSAFENVVLRPRPLVDVSTVDTSTTVLGERISMPLMLAPTGSAYMCNPAAEFAIARATAKAGTIFALSSVASASLEDVAATTEGPLWYQLYPSGDRSAMAETLSRVEATGCRVLCVTIDTPQQPRRDRDVRNGLKKPLRTTPALVLGASVHPRWTVNFLVGRSGADHRRRIGAGQRTFQNLDESLSRLAPVTMGDLQWLRGRWRGRLVVKGVMRGDEVPQIIDLGVDGIVVSNHGGRNLDSGQATIEVLPEVVEAAGGRAEIFVDGGFRRGTDVVKALGLGARACLVGRPYAWALAAGGEAGVSQLLEIMKAEIELAMTFSGCAAVADIDASLVRRRAAGPVGSGASTEPQNRELNGVSR